MSTTVTRIVWIVAFVLVASVALYWFNTSIHPG